MKTQPRTPEPRDPGPLPGHLKDFFREHFPDVDLDTVRVHDTLPWIARFAPISVRAMALGRNIYFDGNFDPSSADGIATIGHELMHVSQWRRAGGFVFGPISFAAMYVWEYALNRLRGMSKYDAYRAIRFEREAERFDRSIRDTLGGAPGAGRPQVRRSGGCPRGAGCASRRDPGTDRATRRDRAASSRPVTLSSRRRVPLRGAPEAFRRARWRDR